MKVWKNVAFRKLSILLALAGCLAAPFFARADQNYSQQVFFDNSLSPGNYFYSSGRASAPSKLLLVNGKIPVETSAFISGPNALELQWLSVPNGGHSITSGHRRIQIA